MPGHVEINRAQMQATLATAGGQWGNRTGRQIVNVAKRLCPVDEGRLRSSINYVVTITPNRVIVNVGSPLEYAIYRHNGTGIYGPKRTPIRPVSAKALKFETPKGAGPMRPGQRRPAKGRRGYVYARSVRGIQGSPFLSDALTEVMGRQNITRPFRPS